MFSCHRLFGILGTAAAIGIALALAVLIPTFSIADDPPAEASTRQERRKKVEDARKARLAAVEPDFGKVYFLADGEVMRHIPEPLDRDLRRKWYGAMFGQEIDERMQIVTLYLQWKDGTAQWKGATVGGGSGGMPIRNVLPMLDAVSSQSIEGDEVLLDKMIPGDWVFDPKASSEKIVAALEPVLQKEWKIPVKLEFREVERDVCVVSGEWHFEPVSDDFRDVQIYGTYLDRNSGSGGGSGNFEKLLKAVGSWINMPVINEVASPPSKGLSWRYHQPSPFTEKEAADAHDAGAVTENLTIQTGLRWRKEERKVRILFVERK